ncbi:MAG: DUF5050 domain-containing protein [Spirochaetales bacterium]|nr:DUF5050 domain-containing protein [Spirochaetales bacterium]
MSRLKKLFLLLLVPIFFTACITDRIIIDGEMALYLQEKINEELVDKECYLRGTSPSNLFNGGYLLEGEDYLYFVNKMEFEDGSTVGYLQRLHLSQKGTLVYDNDLLVDFNGQLLGFWNSNLIALEEGQLLLIDLEEFTKEPISEAQVSRAHSFDETLYYSNLDGDIYSLTPEGEELLIRGVGELLQVDSHYLYTLANGTLEQIDRSELKVTLSLTGGIYEQATFGCESLLFLEDNCLKRQSYATGEIYVTVCDVSAYAREGYILVTASTEGGLYLSNLDGTAKDKLSDDLSHSLLIVEGHLYYLNAYDENQIYTIDIEEGKRSALFSETLTDGGIQFSRYSEEEEKHLLEAYLTFLQGVVGKLSPYEEQPLPYPGKVIFITPNGEFFYRNGEEIGLNDLFYLALITYHPLHLGTYSDGGQAYRIDSTMTLFVPFDPEPILTKVIRGFDPIQIKTGEGDRFGIPASWHPIALDLLESDLF